MENENTYLGLQLILDLYDCDVRTLDDLQLTEKIMNQAAEVAGATILSSNFHPFAPQGISGVVIIKESHLTIHTWPELGFASIDFYTCSPKLTLEKSIDYLIEAFGAQKSEKNIIERGIKLRENIAE